MSDEVVEVVGSVDDLEDGQYVDILLFIVRMFLAYKCYRLMYRVAQKIGTISLYTLTLPNINRFSKLFHCQNQEKICNNTITKDPTTLQVCRYTTL